MTRLILSPSAAVLTVLMLLSVPATAQTLTILLPTLTFPTEDVTGGSMGCGPATGAATCIGQE